MKSVSLFAKSETACIPFSRLNCRGFESLFDSPGLGTIGGNGFLLENLVAHQNANDKNTLGIPYGAMSDRSMVDVFGKVLKEMGETQKGSSTWVALIRWEQKQSRDFLKRLTPARKRKRPLDLYSLLHRK